MKNDLQPGQRVLYMAPVPPKAGTIVSLGTDPNGEPTARVHFDDGTAYMCPRDRLAPEKDPPQGLDNTI